MGVIGSRYCYNWCSMMNDNMERKYTPVSQNDDIANKVIRQQLYSAQSDIKELMKRIEQTEQTDTKHVMNRIEQIEQKIAVLTRQQADIFDSDLVLIHS